MFFKRKKTILPPPKEVGPKPSDVEIFMWWPDNHSGSYNSIKTRMADDDIAVKAVREGERTHPSKQFMKEVKRLKKYPQTVYFTLPRGTKLEKWQRERLDKMCKTMVANNFQDSITVNIGKILS